MTWVAFVLRAASLTAQPLWRDEVDALCYAFEFPDLIIRALSAAPPSLAGAPCACPTLPVPTAADAAGPLQRLAPIFGGIVRQNGPLYFFLLRGWIAGAGTGEYALRFFSLLFGVLSVPLTYVVGRRWFGRQVGFGAAVLMAASPYFIWYSQEVKMYTLVPCLALLALYGMRRAVEGGPVYWWAALVIATSLAIYSHILAALLIPVEILLYFTWWPLARRRWRGAVVSLLCLTAPYLPLIVWQAPQVLRARETGFHPYTLPEMAQILLNGWSTGVLGYGWPWIAGLMGALAVAGGVGFLVRRGSASVTGRNCLALVWWLVIPVLAVWFISLRQPLFTDRYLIWTAPAFYLLVAFGLTVVGAAVHRWAALLLLLIVLAFQGVNWRQQAVVPVKSDFRAAAAYVAERRSPGDLFLFQIPHGRYTFDYYFSAAGGSYPRADGLFTNHRASDGSYVMSEPSAASQMQALTARYDAVWLIATETEMWDERELVKQWLDAHGERGEEAHFARVDVYRYRLVGAADPQR
jgi:hypothetical protein